MQETIHILQKEFDNLNPEQKRAALHTTGPALVLAGAGSGKTKVVAVRIGCLIHQGVASHQILGLTFTNKAANEMKERVHKLVGENVVVSTFHSLGAKILREAIHYLGYAKDFSIYDEDDVEKLLRALSKELFGQDAKVDLKRARSLISQAKNGLPGDSEEDLKKLYELYRKKMKEFNAVDFDDLLFLPVELFREVPDALAYYQTRWPYILVDEYQDTNQTQYEFVRLLAGSSQNLFVVGDPDQSIYSWRGASIRNILNFENDYPGAKLIYLEQNYRSTCTILNASNAVIEKNSNRYEKSLWSSGEEGEKIQIFQAMSEREEAAFVARKIEKLKREGQSLTSFVVFYRTNFQSRVFEDELVAKQIPYTIVGGTSFYQRREIKDILSYLRLVQSPTDHVAFLRIVNLPKRGLGEQFISKVAQAASENQIPIGSIDTLPFPLTPRQKEGWSCFRGAINKLHEIKATNSLANLVRAAIHETNYLVFIDQEEETKSERRENLAELIVKAEEWSDTHEGGQLSQFLEEIALVTSTDVLNPNEERLSLMTAHNSKGLEFDTVFLVGLEEDLFPHINSKKSEELIEEERRLFYVGLTRAKKQLYLSFASLRHIYGRLMPMRQSRFLQEIPHEYKKVCR